MTGPAARGGVLAAFVRAVLAGALAVSAPPLALVAFLMFGSMSPLDAGRTVFLACLLVTGIAVAVIAASGLIVGIPADRSLRRRGWTGRGHYVAAGGLAGPCIAAALMWAVGGVIDAIALFALIGLLGGTVTAAVWWRRRPPFDLTPPLP